MPSTRSTPPPGVELTLSGNPVVFASVLDLLSLILLVIPPVVIALLILAFFATIGDRRLERARDRPGGAWLAVDVRPDLRPRAEVDIVTVIVPIFVIVMGSADGLHFVTHFQEEAESGPRHGGAESRRRSSMSGVPMILTTISTAAGFLVAVGHRRVSRSASSACSPPSASRSPASSRSSRCRRS